MSELVLNPFHYDRFFQPELPLLSMLLLPLEEQARYADAVCRRYCCTKAYLELQQQVLDDAHEGGCWDLTYNTSDMLGNLALLAYAQPQSQWQRLWKSVVQELTSTQRWPSHSIAVECWRKMSPISGETCRRGR